MASRRPVRAFLCLSPVLTLALTSAACDAEPATLPVPATSAAVAPGPPAGWRWASSGGVELAVPADWPYGDSSRRLWQWCVVPAAERAEPVVGRSGVTTQVDCVGPGTWVAQTGSVVEFSRTTEPDLVDERGDRTTVRLAGVQVDVQAPADLRRRIVATIHRADPDSNGCPASHPVSARTIWRPAPPVALTTLTAVTAVSACKYELANATAPGPPRLLSGLRLTGRDAENAIRAVAAAPVGGGPRHPGRCAPKFVYGREGIVLRIESAAGRSEVMVRYSGCNLTGFDDGVQVRALTADAVSPFLAGANNQVDDLGSRETAAVLRGAR